MGEQFKTRCVVYFTCASASNQRPQLLYFAAGA
jgi:hypothetical protein